MVPRRHRPSQTWKTFLRNHAEGIASIVGLLGRLRAAQPHGRNSEPRRRIRAALLHYLGLSLDRYARIEISPAGISTVAVSDWGKNHHPERTDGRMKFVVFASGPLAATS